MANQYKNIPQTKLFLVKIPKKTPEELEILGKQEKDWIKYMDDFYSSLTGIRKKGFFGVEPCFTFEVGKTKSNINFYAHAPAEFSDLLQKQIYSFFPDALIEEVPADYNIFSPDEIVIGGYFTLQKPYFLPIRTYMSFEADPLSNITTALTRLAADEEAVIQINIRNANQLWHERTQRLIKEMQNGREFADAYSRTGAVSTVLRGQQPQIVSNRAVDEETIQALSFKTGKDSFEVNIRVLVSTPKEKKDSAQRILYQISGAFEQFSTPKLNRLALTEVKGSVLDALVYNFSFRKFNRKEVVILNTEELTSIFHFPTPVIQTPDVRILEAKMAPPPANLPAEGLTIGFSDFRGVEKDIKIQDVDRRRHLYIVGQTGTGKSSLLENMIEQDLKSGKGLCVLDPHGDLIEKVLGLVPKERIDDVVMFDPGNLNRVMGLNFLEWDENFPEQKTFVVNELINILDKLYDLRQTGGPIFEQYTRNALLLLMDNSKNKFTLLEVPRVLSNSEFRKSLLAECKNVVVKQFWEEEAEKVGGEAALANMVPYITSKFNTFIANDYVRPIIGQGETTLNFRQIMDEGKILLANLSKGRLGDLNSSLLGLVITGKLSMASFSRIDVSEEKRRDFYLYMDEFQNFCTESISILLSEARKYRLNLIIAHQFLGQLPEEIRKAVFGNVGTICAFRIGAEDAEIFEKEFTPVFSKQDLINLQNFNFYTKITIDGVLSQPFNVKARRPSPAAEEKAAALKEYALFKYGKSREVVDAEIQQRMGNL